MLWKLQSNWWQKWVFRLNCTWIHPRFILFRLPTETSRKEFRKLEMYWVYRTTNKTVIKVSSISFFNDWVESVFNTVPDTNESAHRFYLKEIKERVNTESSITNKLQKSHSNDKLPASSPSVSETKVEREVHSTSPRREVHSKIFSTLPLANDIQYSQSQIAAGTKRRIHGNGVQVLEDRYLVLDQ